MNNDALKAEIALHQQLLAFHRRQLSQLDEQCRLVREQIVTSEVALAFLHALPSNNEIIAAETAEISSTTKPRLESAAARQRSPARRMMIEALEAAGAQGITASALNSLITDADMALDTAEKAKAALKKEGVIGHDPRALRWYAAGCGPADVEAARTERAKTFEEKGEEKTKPRAPRKKARS
ncbi:hypothetical protein [Methylobacterium persicinum]|uniref:MarR family transcriptional regulator n=1 Tax=Methylobacterium persicinum TaxID=374426 RepID=A0ABU0HHP2_9HYPH|nr:hypothetical protein [Methylobacterium persicinum]MDQ0441845.1 hypothetical protein [Methylobacterium persicinum]